MGAFALESLEVYALAEQLADAIWDIAAKWESFDKSTIGHQLVRAADSVGASIAEGCGRASSADNKRFVRTARGSLYEVRHFLRRADKRGLLTQEQKPELHRILSELLPRLNAYLRSLGRVES